MTMMQFKPLVSRFLPVCLGLLLPLGAVHAQILASVEKLQITSQDLDAAIASSPLAVQFPSMDADAQAGLRGDMLKRLVAAKLLYLEARRQGLDKSSDYLADAETYRLGYLYRAYMEKLRSGIQIEAAKLAELRDTYQGEADALEAAKSQEVAQRYKLLKAMSLEFLKEKYHLKVFEDRLAAGIPGTTVLASADGIKVTYAQLSTDDGAYDQQALVDDLYNKLELQLVAKAATEEGTVAPMDRYAEAALPSALVARMERQWIPNEAAMRKFFDAHPDLGQIPERRHVVQLVVATREQAEALRARIVKGESMYELARQFSIDPYGRKQAGDMGWLQAGSAMPAIEAGIAALKDGEVSEVIASPQGFHLVMIESRTEGKQMEFGEVKDRVRQAMVNRRYPGYLAELQKRFNVKWGMPMAADASAAQKLMKQ